MAAAGGRLGLAAAGAPVHFPQLEAPVEPDDGAEGARWQHATGSAGDLLGGGGAGGAAWDGASARRRGLWLLHTGVGGGGLLSAGLLFGGSSPLGST